jgi:UDP-3-O-[3-hydroxymyristoyl] glucosamine N-acyltransferase
MNLSAQYIAELITGTVDGNANSEVSKVAKLEEADEHSLCFFSNPKYEQDLYKTKASVVIVPADFNPSSPVGFTMIRHQNPYYGFCIVLNEHFNPNTHRKGIEPGAYINVTANLGHGVFVGTTAYIDDHAVIGDGCVIYPGCYVGSNCRIGSGTVLYPGVKVYSGCSIGSDCIIHANTVIGSDGFGFAPVGDVYMKIPQVGNVVIEDRVEIGSNCSIDRATMGSTYIRQGAKLDNLIQVAHNAEIGANTVIAAQAGVSGSTKIGANCQIGGQTGFVGHIQIADRVGIGAQSGVSKEISEPGTHWMGSPALPIKDFFKSQAVFKNLPELQKRVNQLENSNLKK